MLIYYPFHARSADVEEIHEWMRSENTYRV